MPPTEITTKTFDNVRRGKERGKKKKSDGCSKQRSTKKKDQGRRIGPAGFDRRSATKPAGLAFGADPTTSSWPHCLIPVAPFSGSYHWYTFFFVITINTFPTFHFEIDLWKIKKMFRRRR